MNAIAAVDRNWAIGREGGLLFHLPSDMKRFRDLTVGGTVILGRKTLETFPGGKPLKDRRNIVITRNSDFTRDGCDIVGCYDQALELTVDPEDDDVWVIGGGRVTGIVDARSATKEQIGLLMTTTKTEAEQQ